MSSTLRAALDELDAKKAVYPKNDRERERNAARYRIKKYKKNHCQDCGLIPTKTSHLDLHHRDGNMENTNESNILTLCGSCHRARH